LKTEHGIVIGIIIGILIGASAYHLVIRTDKDTSELEKQLSEAQIQISILQAEKTALGEELDSTKADLTESQIQLAKMNETHLRLLGLNLVLERDLNITEIALDKARDELNQAQADIISLGEELDAISIPPPPTIVASWTKEEFWQELLDMDISTADVTGRFIKEEYHVTTKQEIEQFIALIGNSDAYQNIPYSEREAERQGHQVTAREFFLLGKLLEWTEGKLAAGIIVQWQTYPEEWYEFTGIGARFLGVIVQENNQYSMYMIRAGPVPELVALRVRKVIFIWM